MADPIFPMVRLARAGGSTSGRVTLPALEARAASVPADHLALDALARALLEHQEYDEARKAARRGIAAAPHDAGCWFTLGLVEFDELRLREAAAAYEEAVRRAPDWAQACRTLGRLYIRWLDEGARSEELYLRAIRLEPHDRDGYVGLGRCCIQGRTWAEALAYARRVAPSVADPLDVQRGVARALEHYGRYTEAWQCRQQVVASEPYDQRSLNALARIAEALCDFDTSLDYHRRAFAVNPRQGESFFYFLFKLGRLDEAHEVYWQTKPELEPFRSRRPDHGPAKSLWHGTTVLLDPQGGYGDTIQFARFATLLKEKGATVILQCKKWLASLLQTVPGVDLVVGKYDERPEADYELVLFLEFYEMLGYAILDTGAQVPYVRPSDMRVAHWKREVAGAPGLKVGLAWASSGSSRHNSYARRSMSPSELRPVLEVPGCSFFGLQKGGGSEVAALPSHLAFRNLGDSFGDFLDAAAAAAAMDVVFTVDSAMAHVAGAVGRPGFLVLPYRSCYRWPLNREDTLWYPAIKRFRQERPGEWKQPVLEAAAALTQLSARASCEPTSSTACA
jgi:tetratricopeptide (TPR) repeat protein